MRVSHAVRMGAWLLVGINLLMALGAIGIFMRMAPAIAVILERNERSLQACEDMLSALALTTSQREYTAVARLSADFQAALDRARKNVTDPEETAAMGAIVAIAPAAFGEHLTARQEIVAAVNRLAKINREAMRVADRHARQLGYAGAWGVVFMAICAFLAGTIFIRTLTRRVVEPLEEINAVIAAHRNGETMRRCTGVDLSQDVRAVFNGINEFLDHCQVHNPPGIRHKDEKSAGNKG